MGTVYIEMRYVNLENVCKNVPEKAEKGLKKIWDANTNTIQNKYNFVLYFSDSMYYSPLKPKKLFKRQLVLMGTG